MIDMIHTRARARANIKLFF